MGATLPNHRRARSGAPQICSVIIQSFASKSLSHMILAIPGLKRVFSGVLVVAGGVFLLSCGGSSSTTTPPSGLKFRAFVSQTVSATTASPGLIVVNAQLDRLGAASPISAGPSPGLMVEPANHQLTLVFNSSDNEVDVVNNAKETSNGKVTLPGSTESMAATSDATLGFAAVPTAPVAGVSPGEVEVINLTSTTLLAPICVPAADGSCGIPNPNPFSGARFVVLSPDNTHLLVFGDNSNAVTVVTLTNLGTTSSPNWNVSNVAQVVGSLDHPVWATFSPDNSTAYILSCGAECGGTTTASVTPLQFTATGPQCTRNCLGATTVLPGGATYSSASGNTVYVVGSEQCAGAVDPTACGKLTILNTSGSAVQVVKSVTITDGYHNQMAVTQDNQVFIGALGCTQIFTSTVHRGCLSIYNGNNGNVVIGTDPGDVTGIASVSGRPQVYVIENGEMRNWTTTTDRLAPALQQIDIVGQAVDVVLAD